jgi:glucosylglycerate synthase
MATANPNLASAEVISSVPASLLVSLVPLSQEAFEATLANLALAFPSQTVLVATPDTVPQLSSGGPLRLLHYTPTEASANPWVLSPIDFVNTFKLAQENNAPACLLLGSESQSLQPEAIRALAAAVPATDLAVASYNLGPREGLLNSAILYPVTRALFCAPPRFPLAIDLGLSPRMAERLAASAQRFTASSQDDALIWPIAEAATANYTITEIEAGVRTFTQPSDDLNTLLTQVTGSLFSDIDTKAVYWQRARSLQPSRKVPPATESAASLTDIIPMIETFHLAYTNLHEIWSLVLPPNSLLGLKRLSLLPAESFNMPDALWARIVYDFILAYRLRTINRGHLLGALTPLYLAWVASHLILVNNGTAPEAHIQKLAATFENDKPYLVSRWRWPDRFNP